MKKQILLFLPLFLAEPFILLFRPFGLTLEGCMLICFAVLGFFYLLMNGRLYDVILSDYPEVVAKRGGSLANKPLMIEQDEGDERLRKLYWRTIAVNAIATVWTLGILVFLGLLALPV